MKLNLKKLSYDKIFIIIFIVIIMILFAFYLFINNPRVYTFSPADRSGKTIFILGSVHGNEPAGTKACYKLMTIKDKNKKFVVSNFYDKEDCYLPDSLACYCNRNKKNYISIETTGLNPNKQDIDVRVNQQLNMLISII
jgi:hypothetical protein